MKHLVLFAALMASSAVWAAAPIAPADISATGTYAIDGPDLDVLDDGYLPPEWTTYTVDSVSWMGQESASGVTLTLDFGQLYTLTDVLLDLDNNDYYQVQVSTNGTQWNTLFTNLAFEGQAASGMEILTSVAGDPEYQATIDFPATVARYARIYAVAGDGYYSVAEMRFSGVAAVPEPETYALWLAGLGLLGVAARRRR